MRRWTILSAALITACCAPRESGAPILPIVLAPADPTPPPERCDPSGDPIVPPGGTPRPVAEGALTLAEVRGDDRLTVAGDHYLLAFSRDGDRLLAASQAGLMIWSASTGDLLRRFDLGVRLDRAQSLSASPDDRWIAVTADLPGTSHGDVAPSLWIVRADGSAPPRRFDGVHGTPRFTPDGRRLFTFDRAWDLEAGTDAPRPPPMGGEAVFLPDGDRVIVFVKGGVHPRETYTPELREVATGRVIRSFPAVSYSGRLAISGDGRRLAILLDDGLSTFSLDPFARVSRIAATDRAERVQLSHDGHLAVTETLHCAVLLSSGSRSDDSLCSKPSLAVWDVDAAKRLLLSPRHAGDIWSISGDGAHLTGDANRLVQYLVRIRDGAEVRLGLRIRAVSDDGRRAAYDDTLGLAIASLDGRTAAPSLARSPRVIARSADGKLTATVGKDGRLRVERPGACVAVGAKARSWIWPGDRFEYIDLDDARVAFSPSGASLMVATNGGTARVRSYDTTDGRERWALRSTGRATGSVFLLPASGQVLFQAQGHPEILRFDADSGAALPAGHAPRVAYARSPFGGSSHEVRSRDADRAQSLSIVLGTRDGSWIATTGALHREMQIASWDPRDPSRVEDRDMGCWAGRMALSPDEGMIALGCTTGGVRLLPRTGGSTRVIAADPKGQVSALAFAPRGDRLAAAGEDGSIVLIDTAAGTVTGRARLPFDPAVQLRISADGRELVAETARGMRIRFHIAAR